MADAYDYANARIRGLRALLLTRMDLESLAEQPDRDHFIAVLARTDYGPDLTEAQSQARGPHTVERAVRLNLSRRIGGLQGLFLDENAGMSSAPARLVQVFLARADLTVLVGILRGMYAEGSAEEIAATLLATGCLTPPQIEHLASSEGIAECIERFSAFGYAFASTVTSVMAGGDAPAGLSEVEGALWRSFHGWADRVLSRREANAAVVRDFFTQEIDAANIVSVLRLAATGRPDAESVQRILRSGGAIPPTTLAALAREPDVEAILAGLRSFPLGRALARSPSLVSIDPVVTIEWSAERYQTRWALAQRYLSPLGIGVFLAYHAAKVEEARTVRLLARAADREWPRARTQELLEFSLH